VGILREKRLSELKATFINNLTHELKTPITNIAVASEVLKQGGASLSGDRQRKYHELIHAENQRLKEQVERVLQMATLERKELPLQKQEVNVHQLLQDIVQSIGLRVQQRTGTLTYTPQAERPVIVADSLHLTNVVYNLLDNADKYSPEAPEISVTTENRPDGIIISIADKGIGIRQELQQYLFDTFYRVPTGDVHNVKGFGLGLSYVKTIAEAHHGSVSLQSEVNRGSCFKVFFPFVG
jgi:two-component system, OmpR family, phosphate regulon sensor histidine kinase PhoR